MYPSSSAAALGDTQSSADNVKRSFIVNRDGLSFLWFLTIHERVECYVVEGFFVFCIIFYFLQ